MDYYKDKAEVTLAWVCTRIIQCPSLFITVLVIILIAPPGGVKDHKWAPYSKILICFEMLPHKWLEIYNKSTALPFENHLQLLIIINKTRSLEITIDVSAIRHVIFQANFGYACLQCIKYFLLTNKFIYQCSLCKSPHSKEPNNWVYLSLGAKTYEKMNKLSYK